MRVLLNFFYFSHIIIDVNAGKNEQISKKQLIVKEIAVNILELNGYKTRTEQLDNELKSFNHLRTEINLDQSSRDYLSLTQKTEVSIPSYIFRGLQTCFYLNRV